MIHILEYGICLFKRIIGLMYGGLIVGEHLINKLRKPIDPSREMKKPPDVNPDF